MLSPKRLRTLVVMLLLLMGGAYYTIFATNSMRVALTASNPTPNVGTEFTVTAKLTVDGEVKTTSGMTFQVYFDSTKLDFVGFDNYYTPGYQTKSSKAYTKSGNPDGDSTTDKYVQIAWADQSKNWPGASANYPLDLTQIRFKAKSLTAETSTNINIVDFDHDFDFGFVGTRTSTTLKVPPGSITGTISGVSKGGAIKVVAYSDPGMTTPAGSATITGLGAYTIDNLAPGTYYVGAFNDVDGSGTKQTTEASGVYTQNPVTVTSGGTASGKDVTLILPNLTISKTATATVNLGGDITYTLTYANTGTADAHNVVISDTLPADTTFKSASNSGSHSNGVVTWNIATLAAASGNQTVSFVVGAPGKGIADQGTIASSAYSITSTETGQVNGMVAATITVRAPVLTLTNQVATSVEAGANLTYTLNYANTGGMAATNVAIADTLPVNTTFVSATGGGAIDGSNVVTWTIASVGAGTNGSVTLTVAVTKPLVNGTKIVNQTYGILSDQTSFQGGPAIETAVTSSPTFTITKTANPTTVVAGKELTYEITVVNTGNADATNVVIRDVIPADTAYKSGFASDGGASDGTAITWNIANLAMNATKKVTFVVVVSAALNNNTTVTNATYNVTCTQGAAKTGDAVPVTVYKPILSVANQADKTAVNLGGTLTYTLTYGNTGGADANNVEIKDTLPANTTYVSSSNSGAYNSTSREVTWSIPSLAKTNGSGTVTVTVTVAGTGIADQTPLVNNTYSIKSDEIATPVAGTAVQTLVNAPVLTVGKTGPAQIPAGDSLTYKIFYRNTGNMAASNVVIRDTIPTDPSVTYVSATGGGTQAGGVVTWTIASAPAAMAQEAFVEFTVTVKDGTANGTKIQNNVYSIQSDQTALTAGQAGVETTVVSQPILNISKVSAPTEVLPGQELTYTISYGNTGNMPAANTVITDELPANTTYVANSANGGVYSASTRTITWTIGALAQKTNGTLSFKVTVDAALPDGATITNGVFRITADGGLTESGQAQTTKVIKPVLGISKQVDKTTVNLGGSLAYTLTFTNTGGADATNVVVKDKIPDNAIFGSADNSGSYNSTTREITWSNITLVKKTGSGTVSFTVNVPASGLADQSQMVNSLYSISSSEVTTPVAGQTPRTTTVRAPVLTFTKQAAPSVAAGADLLYTINYANTGGMAATNVVITDKVPTNTTFVSATGGGAVDGDGVVTWAIGGVGVGANGSVTFIVKVTKPLVNGTKILNQIYGITSDQTGAQTGPAIETIVTSSPTFTITKTANPTPVVAGKELTYEITVVNTGNADATNVVIRDVIPADTAYKSGFASDGGASDGTAITWNIANLAMNATKKVTFVVVVSAALNNNMTVTNATYNVTCTQGAAKTGDAVPVTVYKPILSVANQADKTAVNLGGTLTYTLTYGNTGGADANTVVIKDTLPANTTYVSSSNSGAYNSTSREVTWSIPSLAKTSGSGTVTVTVTVAATGIADQTPLVNNTYSIKSDEIATPVAGTAVAQTVVNAPVLTVRKTGPAQIPADDSLTYTIYYRNTGNMAAGNVVIRDTIPTDPSVTYVSATGGGTLAGGVVTWTIASAPAAMAQEAFVEFTVTVKDGTANGTKIQNTVYSIQSDQTALTAGQTGVETTVVSQPILNISKVSAPTEVLPGQELTYTISYGNTGNMPAANTVITDEIPGNTTYVANSASNGGVYSASTRTITWTIGALAQKTNGTVSFKVTVDAALPDGATITNGVFRITADGGYSQSGQAYTTKVIKPVLGISKQVDKTTVNLGGSLAYTLTFTNTGGADATNVVVKDKIPDNAIFGSADNSGSYNSTTREITWSNLTLVKKTGSGTVSFTVTVPIKDLADQSQLVNSVYSIASAEITTPVAGQTARTTTVRAPKWTLTKQAAPSVEAGAELVYTINYRNIGGMAASNVVIADTLPANTTFVSASNGGAQNGNAVTWAIGNVAVGASGSVTLTVKVGKPLTNGTVISNSGYGIQSDQTSFSASTEVIKTVAISRPVLTIAGAANPSPVAAGKDLTYTLTFSNTGNQDASTVKVRAAIPANTTFKSADDGVTPVNGVLTWNIGNLTTGAQAQSKAFTVTVGSDLADGVKIASGAFSIQSTETSPFVGTAFQTTVTKPILTVTKAAGAATVDADGQIVYTITYENTGNAEATSVVVKDVLPANTAFVSATNNGALNQAGTEVSWNIGTVAAKSGPLTVSFTVKATADAKLTKGTVITNSVYSITSTETGEKAGTTPVAVTVSAPVLTIAKMAKAGNMATAKIGAEDELTYELTVANTGNMAATGLVIKDPVPAKSTYVPGSASDNGTLINNDTEVKWDVASLAAGSSKTVSFRVKATGVNGETITNANYSVTSVQKIGATGTPVSTTIVGAAILNITKVSSAASVTAGKEFTYTITYSNDGNSDAAGVVITDELPANTAFVSADNGGQNAGAVVTWSIGALVKKSGSKTVSFKVLVSASLEDGAKITNANYGITGTGLTKVTGTPVVTDVVKPILAISKTANAQTVNLGGQIVYTIAYENKGSGDATNVVITEKIPDNTTFVSADNGGTYADATRTVTWNIQTLAKKSTATVSYTVGVPAVANANVFKGSTITNNSYKITCGELAAAVEGTAVARTTVKAPALTISKQAAIQASIGNDLVYTITYRNTGDMAATGVVVKDTVPANTTFVSATGGGTLASGVVTWNVGPLGVGASGTVTLTVTVGGTNGDKIINDNYNIASDQTATAAGPRIITLATGNALLKISKAANPAAEVAPGGEITYTITYSNDGNDKASSVKVTETIPANAEYVVGSASDGGVLAGNVLTWTIGDVAKLSGNKTLTFKVKAKSDLKNGMLVVNNSYGIVATGTANPVYGPQVTTKAVIPVLSLTKVANVTNANLGGDITYTLTYTNTGDVEAKSVVIEDTVPAGTTFKSAANSGVLAEGGKVQWNLGTVAKKDIAGFTGTVSFTVTVAASGLANASKITNNTYSITSAEITGKVSGTKAVETAVNAPALSIAKTAPIRVTTGEDLTYTITYRNAGNMDATGVVIADSVPVNTTYKSATDGGYPNGDGTMVTWNIGNLAKNTSRTVSFTVAVKAGLANLTKITNSVYSIISDQTAVVLGTPMETVVASSPAFVVSKAAGASTVQVGGELTYTITYTNKGNVQATGVKITDTLPAGTTYKAASATGGGTVSGSVITWNAGNVAIDAGGTVSFTVTVDSTVADKAVIANANYGVTCTEVTTAATGAAVNTTAYRKVSVANKPTSVEAGNRFVFNVTGESSDYTWEVRRKDGTPTGILLGVYDPANPAAGGIDAATKSFFAPTTAGIYAVKVTGKILGTFEEFEVVVPVKILPAEGRKARLPGQRCRFYFRGHGRYGLQQGLDHRSGQRARRWASIRAPIRVREASSTRATTATPTPRATSGPPRSPRPIR